MKEQLKSRFPQWVNDKEQGKFNLCMSDDIDSLFSCKVLHSLLGYDVKYFYNFNSIYTAQHEKKPTVCVDVAVEKGMTWDNHVVKISNSDIANPQSANINAINGINRDTYFTKYAGSTLLQILSYYDVPMPKSREARLILLCIDSAYKGHYSNDFRAVHRRYMEQLELYDLIDVLDATDDVTDFHEVRSKYNLSGKIKINENGKLDTTINLAEMQGLFDVDLKMSEENFIKTFQFMSCNAKPLPVTPGMSKPDVFSFALTGRDGYKRTMNGRKVGAVN